MCKYNGRLNLPFLLPEFFVRISYEIFYLSNFQGNFSYVLPEFSYVRKFSNDANFHLRQILFYFKFPGAANFERLQIPGAVKFYGATKLEIWLKSNFVGAVAHSARTPCRLLSEIPTEVTIGLNMAAAISRKFEFF